MVVASPSCSPANIMSFLMNRRDEFISILDFTHSRWMYIIIGQYQKLCNILEASIYDIIFGFRLIAYWEISLRYDAWYRLPPPTHRPSLPASLKASHEGAFTPRFLAHTAIGLWSPRKSRRLPRRNYHDSQLKIYRIFPLTTIMPFFCSGAAWNCTHVEVAAAMSLSWQALYIALRWVMLQLL